jgi:hypothetical protein
MGVVSNSCMVARDLQDAIRPSRSQLFLSRESCTILTEGPGFQCRRHQALDRNRNMSRLCHSCARSRVASRPCLRHDGHEMRRIDHCGSLHPGGPNVVPLGAEFARQEWENSWQSSEVKLATNDDAGQRSYRSCSRDCNVFPDLLRKPFSRSL